MSQLVADRSGLIPPVLRRHPMPQGPITLLSRVLPPPGNRVPTVRLEIALAGGLVTSVGDVIAFPRAIGDHHPPHDTPPSALGWVCRQALPGDTIGLVSSARSGAVIS